MRDGVRIWPSQTDWVTHLNSLFPEIRLKRTLEVRGGDSLPTEWVPVPSALYAGIFYDAEALGILDEETASFVPGEMQELRGQVPVQGLKAIFRGRPLASLAERVIEVAEGGLGRRARLSNGKDESKYLLPLKKCVGRAQNPGDVLADVVRAGAVPLGEAILAHCQV